MTASTHVGVGILGYGNVGGSLVRLLLEEAEAIEARTGIRLDIERVAVRNPAKDRPVDLPSGVVTSHARSVVDDPKVDVVVELMGGIEPARTLIANALEQKKPVVTGNKELIANVGASLSHIAADNGVDLLFEAAVGGAIPLIRPLRESLAGEDIRRVLGIVNGTTNYILTMMTEESSSYTDALAEAQRHGFAESDPTADVEGGDAAAKAAIIANVAFGANIVAGDVFSEGISSVTLEDIALAKRLGYIVKLLAVIEKGPKRRVGVRVHPTMVPIEHPLASVRQSFNAVFVEGSSSGELMFYGRGAGGLPTASAVLGDLIDAAHNKWAGSPGRIVRNGGATLWPIGEQSSPFYVSIDVDDEPGMLARVADVFGRHGVSIRSMEQIEFERQARLVFITRSTLERDLRETLRELRQMPSVPHISNVVRVLESS